MSPARSTLRIPREHGAWSVLITSLLAGTAVGGGFTQPVAVFWGTVLAGFLGWTNAVAWWNESKGRPLTALVLWWAVLLFSVALAGCTRLVLADGYRALPLFFSLVGSCALFLGTQGKPAARSIWTELAGIAGLSVLAAAAHYIASGRLTGATAGIWLICLLVFVGSVLHVRFLVRELAARRRSISARVRAGLPSLLYHLAAFVFINALAYSGRLVPLVAPLLIAPSVVKAWWAVATPAPDGPLQIRRIGRIELAYAGIFLVLVLFTAQAW